MPYHGASARYQDALLWEPTGTGGDGRRTFAVHSPEEVRVRWVKKLYDQGEDRGTTYRYDAVCVFDRRVAEGSLLWEGTLDDWLGVGSGGGDEDYLEVVRCADTPDLKNRFVRHTLGMNRWMGTLPGL